jgi:hypothetical protein
MNFGGAGGITEMSPQIHTGSIRFFTRPSKKSLRDLRAPDALDSSITWKTDTRTARSREAPPLRHALFAMTCYPPRHHATT